jgi:hypothetical protein
MNSCALADADADLLQADEHADAVIHVHHVVADLEVAQVREERARRGAPALRGARLLGKDVTLGVDRQAGTRQAEPAREVADADQHRRSVRLLGTIDRRREDVRSRGRSR